MSMVRLVAFAVALAASPGLAHGTPFECLVQFGFGDSLGVGGLCEAASSPFFFRKRCRFAVKVCFNEPVPPEESCTPGAIERLKIKGTGRCEDVKHLREFADALLANGGPGCGPPVPIFVKKAAGRSRCVLHVKATTADGRKDVKRSSSTACRPAGRAPASRPSGTSATRERRDARPADRALAFVVILPPGTLRSVSAPPWAWDRWDSSGPW